MRMFSPAAGRLGWVGLFASAFAFVESSVVVYLRAIYYPGGFAFPLKAIDPGHGVIEVWRELATIVILGSVGVLAGKKRWERFGFFLVAFGVWDILFYACLKVTLGWPTALTDWDVLFLFPLPWIGPVIAPLLIATLMVVCGAIIVIRHERGILFQPGMFSWFAGIGATFLVCYSFMADLPATLHRHSPASYSYWLLGFGLLLYVAGFIDACRPHEGKVAQFRKHS